LQEFLRARKKIHIETKQKKASKKFVLKKKHSWFINFLEQKSPLWPYIKGQKIFLFFSKQIFFTTI
jgi:hypothetical protein